MVTDAATLQRLSVVETEAKDFARRLAVLEHQSQQCSEASLKLLGVVEEQGNALERLRHTLDKHVEQSGHQNLSERVASLEEADKNSKADRKNLWRVLWGMMGFGGGGGVIGFVGWVKHWW